MIFVDKVKYGLFLVVSKTIILLFVFSSFAHADSQIRILMLGDSLTQGYGLEEKKGLVPKLQNCLLYTSPSPRDMRRSRMPSSA